MIACINYQIDEQITDCKYYQLRFEVTDYNFDVLKLEKKLAKAEAKIRKKYGNKLRQLNVNRYY